MSGKYIYYLLVLNMSIFSNVVAHGNVNYITVTAATFLMSTSFFVYELLSNISQRHQLQLQKGRCYWQGTRIIIIAIIILNIYVKLLLHLCLRRYI